MKHEWFSSGVFPGSAREAFWPQSNLRVTLAQRRSVQQRVIGVIRAGRAGPYRRDAETRCTHYYGRMDDIAGSIESARLRGR
jgi:hypothetical protein